MMLIQTGNDALKNIFYCISCYDVDKTRQTKRWQQNHIQ